MMKKLLSLTIFTLVGLSVFAQKDLRKIIAGERGVSKPFTTLAQNDQVPFDPKNARQIFNLNESSDLVLKSTERDNLGFVHYRFYQTYRGIPIENTMYIVHTKAGMLTGMSGTIVTDFDTQMDSRAAASVNGVAAVKAAIQYMNARKYAWEDPAMENRIKLRKGDTKATYFPVAERVWFSSGDDVSPRELHLCYKVDVYSLQPFDRKFIFLDAQTGKISGTKQQMKPTDATGTAATGYSGSQTIHSDLNGSTYRLRDYTKGKGVITLKASNLSDYTSTSSNWSFTTSDKWALDAHFGVASTWTFYKNNFNRNSIDNAGYALTSWVNDPNTTDNAYWDGSEMVYGNLSSNSNGVTAIDVTGHELTHGVTDYTSGLNYSKESGAMNESMSDIMGKSVQFYTKPMDGSWILSNDMNWEIRSFSNPNVDGQPDTYNGKYWTTSSSDNYGVHTNSGVGNFMFYLLVMGGSGTNDIGSAYSVTKIGLSKADQVLYRTETVYLTPTSNYANWRDACISAATDLYGATSNEVIQVKNAWYAVGIGTSGSGGGTTCNAPAGLTASNITSSGATISWNAVSGATSYSVQYKASSASTYTTVSTTSASYTLTSLAAGTTYNYQVATVCSNGTSAYTASTFTTSGTGTITYCASKGSSTTYEYINKVVLGSISNSSGNNNGYGNYTGLSTNLTAGSGYTITLTPGFTSSSYTEYWTVYIDYNHDGILNGSGETVVKVSGSASKAPTFTVPATAKNGATRMRIQMHFASSSTNPCATLDYGEVEDYTVNISGGSGFNDLIASNNLKAQPQNSLTVSPNPVAGNNAQASYTLSKSGNISMKLADLNGRTLQTISLGNQLTGTHTYNLNNFSQLPAGNYIIVLQQDNQIITRTHIAIAR